MIVHPAVIVHGVADVTAALAPGLPVTLLSAPGAGCFAGCLWWREIVALGREVVPGALAIDVLDCAVPASGDVWIKSVKLRVRFGRRDRACAVSRVVGPVRDVEIRGLASASTVTPASSTAARFR